MNHISLYHSLVFLMICSSCKTIGPSTLKHRWGDSLREGHTLSCLEESSGPFTVYIRKHLDHIASQNSTVFTGPLESKKFCIVPIEIDDIDAGSSWDGSLFINTGVLRAAQNDAQFASVIAHELAHITLRHGMTELAEFVALHPEYKAEALALDAALEDARSRQSAALPKILSEVHSWKAYLDRFRTLVQREWNSRRAALDCKAIGRVFVKAEDLAIREAAIPLYEQGYHASLPEFETNACTLLAAEFTADHHRQSVLSNWKETEADEVGYEFYLTAGYREDQFPAFFDNVEAIAGKDSNCDRGIKDHPGDCWRAQNIRAESVKHQNEISRLQGKCCEVFGTELSELKALYKYVGQEPGRKP